MYPNAIGATSASSSSSLGGIGQSPNPASYQAIFDEFEAYPFTEDPNFNVSAAASFRCYACEGIGRRASCSRCQCRGRSEPAKGMMRHPSCDVHGLRADAQAGLPTVLQAIRGTKRTAAQIDEMIGQAQWFFFNRCAASVSHS